MSPFDTVALPPLGFEASAAACAEADAIVMLPAHALYRRLLADQESEAVHVAARRVLDGFLRNADVQTGSACDVAATVAATVSAARAELASQLAAAPFQAAPFPSAERAVVLRERAPLALLGGCWLDVVSQPATQPSVLVNRLLHQHFRLCGEGNPARSLTARRRHDLERAGVFLPDIGAEGFLDAAAVRPLTALHGCFYLALSRLPGNFLPELAGVHYAWGALGVDDLLAGGPPALPEPSLREVLSLFLESADADATARMRRAAALVVELEREHAAMLAELATWQSRLPLEAKIAAIVAKHAGYAGSHHHRVRVAGRSLADTFADPAFDVASFLASFRESPHLRGDGDGMCEFIRALKLGGPMFGIFDEDEAQTLRMWAASVQTGARPSIDVPVCTAGDSRTRARAACVAAAAPADLRVRALPDLTDRELFYRLVNIENYPNTRREAFSRASAMFDKAELMFDHGAGGRYTDASWFDYSPQALYDRADTIYRSKLLAPYQPLDQIPSRDEVIFLQTTYALGALVDATWIHRVANLGRRDRDCDGALLAIYADEMGHGDMRKNHITLIYRALSSMGIDLPHIRDQGFMTQADLPDDLYGFSLHQLCMALFPDTFYCEILGYNLAIEMFGLGELRLHEIQKLRHYGFDDRYEQAHLTIDNLSAGHSKQAADIIVSYLDGVRRTLDESAVREQWRRVWRGYASLAYIVEHVLVKDLRTQTVDVLL